MKKHVKNSPSTCPFCDMAATNLANLAVHVLFNHKDEEGGLASINKKIAAMRSGIAQGVVEPKLEQGLEPKPKVEPRVSVKEVRAMPEFCPDCFKLEQAAELTKRDHQHSLEKLEAERDTAKQQLEAAVNAHTSPTSDLFEHWETCPNCKPKLESLVRERYIEPAYARGQESPTMEGMESKLAEIGFLPPIKKIRIK